MEENNYTDKLQSCRNLEIDPVIMKEHAHSNWIPKMIEIPSVGKYQDDYHDEQFFLDLSNTQSSLSFDISNDEGFSDGIASQSVLDKLNKTSSIFTDWTDYFADFHGVDEQKNLTNMDVSFSESRKLSLNPREILNQVDHVNYDDNVSAEYTDISTNQYAGSLLINASDILNQVHNISADDRHSENDMPNRTLDTNKVINLQSQPNSGDEGLSNMDYEQEPLGFNQQGNESDIQEATSENGANLDGLSNMDYEQEPLGFNQQGNESDIQEATSENGANLDGLSNMDYEQEPLGFNQQGNESDIQEATSENGANLDGLSNMDYEQEPLGFIQQGNESDIPEATRDNDANLDGTKLDFLRDTNSTKKSQERDDVESSDPESTTVQVKKEKRSHLKKDPKDLAIGKNCKAKLDLALKAVEDGMKYRDAAEEFGVSIGTISNWRNKKVSHKGTGPANKLPSDLEQQIADYLEESFLNLNPKYKKQLLDELDYFFSTSTTINQIGKFSVGFGWIDGLESRHSKAVFVSRPEARIYSKKNCSDVDQWTAIRKRHLEHIDEPVLPNNLSQVVVLDLVKLRSGGEPNMAYDVLVAYVATGKLLKLYIKNEPSLSARSKEILHNKLGLLMERNGEPSPSSLAVVVHDIER